MRRRPRRRTSCSRSPNSAPLSDLQRAKAARLRAQMEFARSRGGDTDAPRLAEPAAQLLDAAKRLETLDDDLARETYLEALAAAMYAGRLGEPGALANVAEAALRCGRPRTELHRPIDLLLSGMAERIVGGASAGFDPTAYRVGAHVRTGAAGRRPSAALDVAGLADSAGDAPPAELWDDEIWHQMATEMVRHARDAGALAVLPTALAYRAGVHVLAGEFASAATLIEEADSITAATGYAPLRYHSLNLAAWRGIPADAVELIEAVAADGTARGEGRAARRDRIPLRRPLQRARTIRGGVRRRPGGCEDEDLGFHSWCSVRTDRSRGAHR